MHNVVVVQNDENAYAQRMQNSPANLFWDSPQPENEKHTRIFHLKTRQLSYELAQPDGGGVVRCILHC